MISEKFTNNTYIEKAQWEGRHSWDIPYIELEQLDTPCYVTDAKLLRRNLNILHSVKQMTGCKILLAQKCFSMFRAYFLLSEVLDGTTSSGLHEAKLAFEEMSNREAHVYKPAYTETEFSELTQYVGHIIFNSMSQWEKYSALALEKGISCGLRVNPEYSEQDYALYDPCAPGSRLGVLAGSLPSNLPVGVKGFHFHTLCEQDADVFSRTLQVFEEKFGKYLPFLDWVNFGGGHHITRPGYQLNLLQSAILAFQKRHPNLQVYLEPGEAVALNAGFLVSRVLDIVKNGEISIAILDTSAACHMPDVLEMPYTPRIIGAVAANADDFMPDSSKFCYRLAGPTCLAGDIIGEYQFSAPLTVGEILVFCDMAIYSMVKNNTFNGMPLPSIYFYSEDRHMELVRAFGYEDFKMRLS